MNDKSYTYIFLSHELFNNGVKIRLKWKHLYIYRIGRVDH